MTLIRDAPEILADTGPFCRLAEAGEAHLDAAAEFLRPNVRIVEDVRKELRRRSRTPIDARLARLAPIRDRVRDLDLEIRAGLHTGECELLSDDDDIGGLAVHIGARISSLAGPGEVLVSSTVRDLSVGSGQTLTDRGEHDLKGVPGPWRLFAVET